MINNILVKQTVYVSLLMQLVTTLISLDGLNYNLLPRDSVLHDILILEAIVQFIEAGFYIWVILALKELDKMKKTAYLINTSRGPIVNEDDLIIALSTNEIAGAGLDVYEKEPLPENNKLRFLPNTLLTPHIGYVTAENYTIYYTQMIESLEACVEGKPIRIIE